MAERIYNVQGLHKKRPKRPKTPLKHSLFDSNNSFKIGVGTVIINVSCYTGIRTVSNTLYTSDDERKRSVVYGIYATLS